MIVSQSCNHQHVQILYQRLFISTWNRKYLGDVPGRITLVLDVHERFEMVNPNPRITSVFNRHETNWEQSCPMQEMPSYISRWRRRETARQGRPEASASVSTFARRWSRFDGDSGPRMWPLGGCYGPISQPIITPTVREFSAIVCSLTRRSFLIVRVIITVVTGVCVRAERPAGHDHVHVFEIKRERFTQTSWRHSTRMQRGNWIP